MVSRLQISWRTGVNMREFAYYGTAARRFTDIGLQRRQLDQLRDMGANLVRFYAPFEQFSTSECINRVIGALDLLNSYRMQAIICLNDSIGGDSVFIVQGDREFHTGPIGHLNKRYWHEQIFRRNLLPFAISLVGACGTHPAVFMWELGNEYAIHPQPATPDDARAFLAFAREASEAIKNAAPQSLVSTGLVGSHHVAPAGDDGRFGRELYGLPSIDAISIHYYADDGERQYVEWEVAIAKALNKPYYIGEFGAPDNWPDRARFYNEQLQEWFARGAFTALPWAFDASPRDVGVSDTKAFAGIRPAFGEVIAHMRTFSRPAERPVLILEFGSTVPAQPTGDVARGGAAPGATPAAQTKIFRVVDGPLFVRSAPSLAPGTRLRGRMLLNDQQIVVDATSRTEADQYVWWRHSEGWTAEKSLDNLEINMIEIVSAPQPVQPAPAPVDTQPTPAAPPVIQPALPPAAHPLPQPLGPFAPKLTKLLRVIDGPIYVRDAPTREQRALIKGIALRTGQKVKVDAESRTEAEGYVWWRHEAGWSAERSLSDPSEILMIEESQIPDASALFERFPLDLDVMRWFYYYGNTRYAFEVGKEKNYDSYSQGLHGGLDFGHPGGASIFAGVRADLKAVCTYVGNGRKFLPNRVDITVGPYLLIFGHVASPNFGLQGQIVGPETAIGVVDSSEKHMHLEIRRGSKILNPLGFFPAALCEALFRKFQATGEFAFQPFGGKWETPFDQPEIEISGKVIGPRGS